MKVVKDNRMISKEESHKIQTAGEKFKDETDIKT